MLPWILLTWVAVAVLLVSEWRGARAGVWIAKPVASTGFVLAALAAGALDSTYGRFVLGALVLSWLGDVLLIPKAKASFLAGLASFLLGHVAFAAAFLVRGVSPLALGAAALPLAGAARAALRWLRPHVPDAMRAPVQAYVIVISAMVACAVGTVWAAGNPLVLLGALAFFVSDLAVARERFVENTVRNKLWGLPLYYGAQLLLASTVMR
jgi:uncharacterized membrane protein YhhN